MADKPDTVTFFGYIPQPGISVEEYTDFVGRTLSINDFKRTLRRGYLPRGIMFTDSHNRWGVVLCKTTVTAELSR